MHGETSKYVSILLTFNQKELIEEKHRTVNQH